VEELFIKGAAAVGFGGDLATFRDVGEGLIAEFLGEAIIGDDGGDFEIVQKTAVVEVI